MNKLQEIAVALGATAFLLCSMVACDGEPTVASANPTAEPVEAVEVPEEAEASELAELADSKEQPGRRAQVARTAARTVGSIGGSIRLSDRIAAVYSIALRDGDAWLDGVALLRGKERTWYTKNVDAVPNTMNNLGIGGSVGPHLVVVTPKADAVWLDDSLFAPLTKGNVVLFDGAGDEPKVIGHAKIDAYLGPAPIDDATQRRSLIQERLRALLSNSKDIQDQWPSG